MAICVACPCGQTFQVENEWAGTRARCPYCGTNQVVRGQPAPRGRVPPAARSADRLAVEDQPAATPAGRLWLPGVVILLLGLAGFGTILFLHETKDPAPAGNAPDPPAFDRLKLGFQVKGSATSGWRTTESAGDPLTPYQAWDVSLELQNGTDQDVRLGNDLFLIEANRDGSAFDGVALFRGRPADPDASVIALMDTESDILDAYGLSNYEIAYRDGRSGSRKGDDVALGPAPAPAPSGPTPADFGLGRLAAGRTRALRFRGEQGTRLNDDLRQSLCVVLPELRIDAPDGEGRYRLFLYFPVPGGGDQAEPVVRQEWMKIDRAELAKVVEAADANPVQRILAANWLTAADAGAARAALLRAMPEVRQAKLLVSYLHLLTRQKVDGLGPQALTWLQDPEMAPDVRRLSAEYLGTLGYEPALAALTAAAGAEDNVVARGAILGLAANGNRPAVDALLALLKDERQRARHLAVARGLARTGDAAAVQVLEEMAGGGNLTALWALAENAAPARFPFFADLSRKELPPDQRQLALYGLRRSGAERAGPVLLELLQKEGPPPTANPLQGSALVRELTVLNSPKLVPELTALARRGNLRALQVLAGYRDESALAPLQERARNAPPAGQLIALSGLASHWPGPSVAVFHSALSSGEPEVVLQAARGLTRGEDPAAVALALPALNHPDPYVRAGVAGALATLPADRYAAQWLETILATDDDQVALALANALLKDGWKDRAAVPRLGAKLKEAHGDMRYQAIRLLRHLSGNAMGPATYFEYQADPDGWGRKWTGWAFATEPAKG